MGRAMNVPRSSFPHFVVLSFERPEGERFAIFHPDEWIRTASPTRWGTIRDRAVAMEEFVRSLELLTEESVRARLEDMGLAGDVVTGHIVKARNIRQMNMKGGSWEVVTAVGYRNEEGQEVVVKTSRTGGDPEQRVFVMGCTVCGHEYGTYGSEIPHRCCPNCQDGPPGLPV
jgi:hypothetical protein